MTPMITYNRSFFAYPPFIKKILIPHGSQNTASKKYKTHLLKSMFNFRQK